MFICGFDISELDQEKFPLVPISHNRYLHHEKRALVHNFEMTCYHVAPNLPAEFPRNSMRNKRSKRDKRTMRN